MTFMVALLPFPGWSVAEPGQDGDVYDQFAYQEWEWRSWSPLTFKEQARRYLTQFLRGDRPSDKPATVAAEHGADVSFYWPINDETEIANDVIDGLIRDPKIVRRINEIERGWANIHDPASWQDTEVVLPRRG